MTEKKRIGRKGKKYYVSVIGAADATPSQYESAEKVGRLIADAGCILVCGGLGGVMEAAAKGSESAGGLSLGILPGIDRDRANSYLTMTIPTGMSHGRNYLVAAAGDGVIGIGGGAGTLSEIGLALKFLKPVVLLESLDVNAAGLEDKTIYKATTAEEAVRVLIGTLK